MRLIAQRFNRVGVNLGGRAPRARAAGGSIPEPIRGIDEFRLSVVFVLDPEGHVNEVVQLDEPA